MNIREQLEAREELYLSPYASYSSRSLGRAVPEEPDDIRPCFQRDRDRILHSKAFRRLKQKTQVFLDPIGDHYRTRLTHTLEVSQIGRTICKALAMNEDLVEAIALGHDLGHTPFGHAGERALNEISSSGFSHNEQSVRIVDVLERDGHGLNLTQEVRDGILHHKSSGNPATLEGRIIQFADKIAYLHHDIDDSIRAGIMKNSDIPAEIRSCLGEDTKQRLDTLVHDIIKESMGNDYIAMSYECYEGMLALRRFMFEHVYTNPLAKGEEKKVFDLISGLFEYYLHHLDLLPEDYRNRAGSDDEDAEQSVCDYIAGMTDQFAIDQFEEFYIPKSWRY